MIRALLTGILYGEPQARKANNAVALSGKLEVSAYTAKDGSPAAGLSVVCDELAALKAKPRPKPSPAPAPVAAGFDDDLPDWCA